MRKVFFLLFLLLAVRCAALPALSSDKQYRLVCVKYPSGFVALGSEHGQQTPLYYFNSATTAADTYWILTKQDDDSYTIQNAKTKAFVTYDGERIEAYKRYIDLTDSAQGYNSCWRFNAIGTETFEIRNVGNDSHLWDVRSGSMMVGTYASANAATNQQFYIVDEDGNRVKDIVDLSKYLPKETPLDAAFDSLMFNLRGMPYDTRNAQYMYSVQEEDIDAGFTANVSYIKKDGWGDLQIAGTKVESGSDYKFSSIQGGKTFTLKATRLDNTQTITAKVTFTSLPVVEINGNFGYDYTEGYIRVFENNKEQPELFRTKMKWRGGITNNADKHKRNYNIKLYKDDGEKKNKKYFGLRDDNRWILDAGQVDMSRVRNRVLTELWLDFCHKPYYIEQAPKALSAVRGTMVELTYNGSYQGVYHMTERLDRKQMKLLDYDEVTQVQHGQLWKGKDWSYAVFMGHYSDNKNYPKTAPSTPNVWSENWENYVVEYPDIEDVSPTDWTTLYNAVELIASKSEREIYEQFCEYFDYPVFMDYYILMESTLATDNHGKNAYYGVYDKQTDKKITVSVWDMDATLGQRWSDAYYHSDLMKPEQDYAEYIINHEHGDWNIFRMLRNLNINNFNEQVRYRYRELRQGALHTDSICERFEKAIGKMKNCGAAAREKSRWSGDTDINRLTLDFDGELAFIKDWVTRRMNYLDKTRFKIDELPPLGIDDVLADNGFHFNLAGHSVIIDAVKSQTINIYSTNGVLVRAVDVVPGINEVRGLPAGIYIIGKKKVVVK